MVQETVNSLFCSIFTAGSVGVGGLAWCFLFTPEMYLNSFMNILFSGLFFHPFPLTISCTILIRLKSLESLDSESSFSILYVASVHAHFTLGYCLISYPSNCLSVV